MVRQFVKIAGFYRKNLQINKKAVSLRHTQHEVGRMEQT